jgi:hypothetical protein
MDAYYALPPLDRRKVIWRMGWNTPTQFQEDMDGWPPRAILGRPVQFVDEQWLSLCVEHNRPLWPRPKSRMPPCFAR